MSALQAFNIDFSLMWEREEAKSFDVTTGHAQTTPTYHTLTSEEVGHYVTKRNKSHVQWTFLTYHNMNYTRVARDGHVYSSSGFDLDLDLSRCSDLGMASRSSPLDESTQPSLCSFPCVYITPPESRDGSFLEEQWCILSVGPPFMYTIPQFEILSVELRKIEVERNVDGGETERFHAFVRNDPELCDNYPAIVFVRDMFLIQADMIGSCVNMGDMKTSKGVYYVLWEWDVIDDDVMEHTDEYKENASDSDADSQADADEISPSDTHTVTFKCIGANHSPNYQATLKKASELLREGYNVPVKLVPEPDNPVDSKAIAFKCQIGEKWFTIGYVVSEALDHVHKEMVKDNILSVEFSWARYLMTWYRCGPGYYAGINVTIRGRWPQVIVKCASTR